MVLKIMFTWICKRENIYKKAIVIWWCGVLERWKLCLLLNSLIPFDCLDHLNTF